jgi:signal transduction histidine kinase
MCMQAVDKTTNFIHELIDISKIKFIRANFKRELLDFEKIALSEISGISELAKKNNQDLKYYVSSKESNLWGDKEKLSRAVMNLLSNAVKYTPAGGRIYVEVSDDEDTVKFKVTNTGPGISPDKMDRLFNKYERFSQDSKVEGTGLGLSIVKDIVNLHKGHLIAKSQPGQETEFDIVLPKDLRAKGRHK